ncbi:3-deoxy-d-manno-octulosonate cytidylyltransferase [Lasius niger]|uniref:3-deoxy-d-manno-octulosonate cytidylyltransferase n=1 Tax=Lasius niger TaxID=67767 RepID=A0A0J7L296_LASNI|nr:3-deoxy-d-manno-octulosonate cytidylyltransferase [Lasius niger]
MITLYATLVEEIAKLKCAIAGCEILCEPLQIEKSFQKDTMGRLAVRNESEKGNYLVAVTHHVMHGDQSFEDHRPVCVLRAFYQEIRELRYGDVRLIGAVD